MAVDLDLLRQIVVLQFEIKIIGAQRLPDLAKSLGSSVKEFKKGINEVTKDDATSTAKREEASGAGKKEDEKKA